MVDGQTQTASRTARSGFAEHAVGGCVVCGSREVRTDAVEQHGWLLLAECPHCDYRWTQPLRETDPPVRRALRVAASGVQQPEVASAA